MSGSPSTTPDQPRAASLPPPFAAALERYLASLGQEPGLSSHTEEAYRRDLERYSHIVSSRGCRAPVEVTAADVTQALEDLAARGLSPATVARSASAIRRYHAFLVAAGISPSDPAADLRLTRIDRQRPDPLTVEEVERLLAGTDGDTPLTRRDRAVLELLYAAGLKVSELTALQLDEVLTDAALVRVAGGTRRQRVVPVGGEAVQWLEGYRRHGRPSLAGPDSGRVFFLSSRGRPLSRMTVWKIIRAAAQRVSLERPVSPHALRHTFAAHLLEGGADLRDVQQLLGHAHISTTQIYAHADEEHLRRVHQTYHPRAV